MDRTTSPRTLALAAALSLTVPQVACAAAPGAPAMAPGAASVSRAGPDAPRAFLEAFARGYVQGLSGEVVWVSRPGVFFTEASTVRNHGSAWAYDTRVPLVFYGPGQVVARDMGAARAQSFDIPATLAAVAGVPPPPRSEGRAWTEILAPERKPVRALVVVMMDQVGTQDLERYLDRMPNLARWRRLGADFPEVRNAWLPSVTAMAHAAVGTGTLPGTCGVPSNFLLRRGGTEFYDVFRTPEGAIDLGLLRVPSFAEVFDEHFDNRPVVLAQVYAHYAALALAGTGRARAGGDADVVVWYDTVTGHLETDEDHFRLPEYLRERTTDELVTRHRKAFLEQFQGRVPAGALATLFARKAIRATPLFARWQADNLLEMVTREGVGQDETPDLVLVNLKATDATGHLFGHDHPAYPACLAEVDRMLGALEHLLDRRAGPGTWAVAVTADHGLVPDDGKRRVCEELVADLNRRLDHDGDGKGPVANSRAYELYMDPEEMAQDGVRLEEVREALAADPDVLHAWTRTEVEEARRGLTSSHP